MVSSAAFHPSKVDKSLSVDLEQLLCADGLESNALYPDLPRSVGLYALRISDLIAMTATVEHRPIWLNWYHGGVQKITHGARKKMAKAAVAVVPIDQEAAAAFQTVGIIVES